MKRNIIFICLLILIIVMIIGYGLYNRKGNANKMDAILIKEHNTELPDYITIINDYNEFKKYFNSDELKLNDFDNNNYAVIKIKYDPCTDKDIELANYTIKNNVIDAIINYKKTCGVCPFNTMYYLIKLNKNTKSIRINNNYNIIEQEQCDPNISYKPMIYIYPDVDKKVSIELGNAELLTTTYPKYNNGWQVFAKTNGDLIINGKTYYGLYWEGYNNVDESFDDGFIVNKKELISFFEDKLNILGLNERETNEFIVYWLPILEQNEYNLIRFEDIDTINRQMPLIINPIPDTVIRVLMKYKPINRDYKIKEQKLKQANRYGYSVIEWGGTKVKS